MSNSNPKKNIVITKYDPIKILNKKGLLNEVAIKCRYDLMHLNDYYKQEKIKFKDNNLFMRNRDECDKDIINYKKMVTEFSQDQLTNRAMVIKNKILDSNIFNAIDKLEHGKMRKHTKLRHTKNIVNLSHDSELVLEGHDKPKVDFSYKNFKLNERRILSRNNKLQSLQFENLLKAGASLKNKSVIGNYNMHSSVISKSKSKPKSPSKIKMLQYGKFPKLKRRSKILIKDNTSSINTYPTYLEEDSYINFKSMQENTVDNNFNYSASKASIDSKESTKLIQMLPDIIRKTNSKDVLEFTNICLHSKGMDLMKNYLYSAEEAKSRQARRLSSVNISPLTNKTNKIVFHKGSHKFLHLLVPLNEEKLYTDFSKMQVMNTEDTYNSVNEIFGVRIQNKENQIKNEGGIQIYIKKEEFIKPVNITIISKLNQLNKTRKKLKTIDTLQTLNTSSNEIIPTLMTQAPKKKRIPFDEQNKNKSKAELKEHYINLDIITKKIEDEFKKFNKQIEKNYYEKEDTKISNLNTNVVGHWRSSIDDRGDSSSRFMEKSINY